MNLRVAKKWATALRGDEFPQCIAALKTFGAEPEEDSYCALGVLCELYRRETGDGDWLMVRGGLGPCGPMLTGLFHGASCSLPKAVMEWAEVSDARGLAGAKSIATLNDSGLDFKAIAKFVEANKGKL